MICRGFYIETQKNIRLFFLFTISTAVQYTIGNVKMIWHTNVCDKWHVRLENEKLNRRMTMKQKELKEFVSLHGQICNFSLMGSACTCLLLFIFW